MLKKTNDPHKVDATELAAHLADYIISLASANTVDGTQRKRLLCKGGSSTFVVTRCYHVATGVGPENCPIEQAVYSGPDLNEAVRIYNGLS